MSRRVTQLKPIDSTPAALTTEQLVADGVATAAAAQKFLGLGRTGFDLLVKNHALVFWKEGRDRVFPMAGLRAHLANKAREEHAGISSPPSPTATSSELPPMSPSVATSLSSLLERMQRMETALERLELATRRIAGAASGTKAIVPAPSSDIWSAGVLDTPGALKFLRCSKPTLRTIARQNKWPRKYLGTKVLFPLAAVQAFVQSLPDEPPPKLKARAEQINAKVMGTI